MKTIDKIFKVVAGITAGAMIYSCGIIPCKKDLEFDKEGTSVNNAPRISSFSCPEKIKIGEQGVCHFEASDAEGNPISYSVDKDWNFKFYNNDINFTAPNEKDLYDVTLEACDSAGNCSYSTTKIRVDEDSDGDGLYNYEEDKNGNGIVDEGETDPYNPDSDGDGYSDGEEDKNGNGIVDEGETDPTDPEDYPVEITEPESITGDCNDITYFDVNSNVEGEDGVSYSAQFLDNAGGAFYNAIIDPVTGEGSYDADCFENKQGSLEVKLMKDDEEVGSKTITLSNNYESPLTAILTKNFDEHGNVNWISTTTSTRDGEEGELDTLYESFNDGAADSTTDVSYANTKYVQMKTNVSIIDGENNILYKARTKGGDEGIATDSFVPGSYQDLLNAIDDELDARGISDHTGDWYALNPSGEGCPSGTNTAFMERIFDYNGNHYRIRVADFSNPTDVYDAKVSSQYGNCTEILDEENLYVIGDPVDSIPQTMENFLGPIE